MFENIAKFFKKLFKAESQETSSRETAKERLHLVLMQDRANVSADFLEMMKQEIIEVIKKYIDVDENAIDVKLTNKTNEDGTNGAPALYANIPIISIKEEKKEEENTNRVEKAVEENAEKPKEENKKAKKQNSKKDEDNSKEEKVEEQNDDTDAKKEEENKEESTGTSEEEKEEADSIN